MWRKLIFLISFVLVAGLVNSALAVSWTNGGGDNMWCNRNNWNPVGVPTSSSLVSITSSPNDTVVIGSGCDAKAMDVDWDLNANHLCPTKWPQIYPPDI